MRTGLSGLAATVVLVAMGSAGPQPQRAEVGKPAPDFALKGTDGKTYKLADYKDKTVVLEWINRDCPVSRARLPIMRELARKYGKKGVVWLAIDSTHYQKPEKMAEYIEQNKLPYPVLMDPDGRVGRLYGARTTPHMYVIHNATLVYAGAIDDGNNRRAGQRNYVAEVLDAVLAGKQPPISRTRPYGCSVKYKP